MTGARGKQVSYALAYRSRFKKCIKLRKQTILNEMRQVCLRKFIDKAVNLINTYNIKTACIENSWKGYSILQKHTLGKTNEQRNKQTTTKNYLS